MVRYRRKKVIRRERWSKRDEQRDKHLERRGLEGRGNANVLPQSALASHNPPCPGLSKGPQSCCPLKPQWPSAGQTTYQVFSALPQSSAGPSASEPGHPFPSSVFLPPPPVSLLPSVPPLSLLRAVLPAASAPSPGPSLPLRCRPQPTPPCTVPAVRKARDSTLEN